MYTLVCAEASYTQTCSGSPEVCTASCSDPQWMVVPGLLPPLSVSDSLIIASAILSVWGAAVAYRMVRRFAVKR